VWGLFNESMVKVADDVLSGRGDELVAVGKARDAISKPYREVDTQTHQIGIIVPPPDIKAVADKTAQFVAKNGTWWRRDAWYC
jgi:hypothetical protein